MDAFFYLAAPIQSEEPTSQSPTTEGPEVFVDWDSTFGYVGVHSGCVIA